MRYKQEVEDYLAKKVESMLAEVIGPGNAVVRVSADIETEATTMTEEKYDPEGQVVRNQTTTEDTSSSVESRANGGNVGVSANVPEKANGSSDSSRPTATTQQDRKNHTISYEINRTLTNITRSPGTIRSITAAVFIAPRAAATAGGAPGSTTKRTPDELNELRQIVINALGLKAAPGQSLDSLVTIEEEPFAVEPVTQETAAVQGEGQVLTWLEAASHWAGFVGAGLVMLVFLRMLSRQKAEPIPVEVLTLSPDAVARSLPSTTHVSADTLNELIRQKPANIGAALRDWVATNNN
jgi:flagellar M-ring protein FliF